VNPLVALVLRSPLHGLLSDRLLLLTFPGHRSGRRYATPVGYVEASGVLLLATAGRWGTNLRGGAPVAVRLRGARRTGVATAITDEPATAAAHQVMLVAAPATGRVTGVVLDPDGRPNRDAVVRAARRGLVVIRVHLD